MATEKSNTADTNNFVALTTTNEMPSNEITEKAHIPEDEEYVEHRMTKAKWLACIALGISYTTAFQQGATVGAIIKSIDQVLGMFVKPLDA
jgi:hypothetical protein